MFIAIDAGTTRTRAWLVADGVVLAEQRATVGVRDTAREGSNETLVAALREMIHALDVAAPGPRPPLVASGMIGSSLGLGHVPHLPAPAGVEDLARALRPLLAPGLGDRPVWVVPGVRNALLDDDDAGDGDVMRGEETTCVGAVALGLLTPGDAFFSVGSHWKRIAVDAAGRVAGGRTSMGGEIVEALRTATILEEAVPASWPETLPDGAVDEGIALAARAGLPRAAFEVRLRQLARQGAPVDRLGLLAGIVIGTDVERWPAPLAAGRLIVAGAAPMADAWHRVLVARGWPAVRLPLEAVERAQRTGLEAIAHRAGLLARR